MLDNPSLTVNITSWRGYVISRFGHEACRPARGRRYSTIVTRDAQPREDDNRSPPEKFALSRARAV